MVRRCLGFALPALTPLALALVLSGCGEAHRSPPPACTNSASDIERALQAAPGPVSLPDGTSLSTCIARATSDADLENVGAVFSRAADDLALGLPRDRAAALQLGYLIGATRRGAVHSQGISTELARRVAQSANVEGLPAAVAAALQRGLAAGEGRG